MLWDVREGVCLLPSCWADALSIHMARRSLVKQSFKIGFAVVRSSIIDTILRMERFVEKPVWSPRRRAVHEVVVVRT